MNERIAELEDKCWDYGRGIVNTRKFAELIVRECAHEAFEFWCNQVDCNEESAQSHIKKHFGVE